MGTDPQVPSSNQGVSAAPGRASNELWERLLSRCAARDQSALAELYDQSASLVYGVALRVLGNAADAEEVSADVYHQVWRTAATYEGARGSVAAWIVTVARNRAIDRLRSRANRVRAEEPIEGRDHLAAVTGDPEQATAASQRRRRVQSAMASLPPEQRQAITLAFFSGLTHSELAARLNLPLGTVKTRIRSGMMKLREGLGELTA